MEEERKTKEIPKGKHGGYRPGAGRKPKSLSAAQKLSDKRDLDAFLNTGSTLKPPDYLGDVAKVKWNELIASYQKNENRSEHLGFNSASPLCSIL
jgi:hypothetical protein